MLLVLRYTIFVLLQTTITATTSLKLLTYIFLSNCEIVCLQEHWLSEVQIHSLKSLVENFRRSRHCKFMFAATYQDLYNSVPYDHAEMVEIKYEFVGSIVVRNHMILISFKYCGRCADSSRQTEIYNQNDGTRYLHTNLLKFAVTIYFGTYNSCSCVLFCTVQCLMTYFSAPHQHVQQTDAVLTCRAPVIIVA